MKFFTARNDDFSNRAFYSHLKFLGIKLVPKLSIGNVQVNVIPY